jgi:chlorite dismutase
MTDIARWQPARLPRPRTDGAGDAAESSRQFVRFAFYTLDPAWFQFDVSTRQAEAQELAAVIEGHRDRLLVHSYTTFGVHAETDFLLWQVARHLEDFETLAVAMRRTRMGSHLRTPCSYLGMTNPSRRGVRGSTLIDGRYLLVCPFIMTAAWDVLPEEERREMTRELIRLAPESPGTDWDTTYAAGLDAHDGILAFEFDRPEFLPDALEGLRKTRSSQYIRRGMPTFTCMRQDPPAALTRISGV